MCHVVPWHIVSHTSSPASYSYYITKKTPRGQTIYNSHAISPSSCQTVRKRLRTFSTTFFLTVTQNDKASFTCRAFISSLKVRLFLLSISHSFICFCMFCAAVFWATSTFQTRTELLRESRHSGAFPVIYWIKYVCQWRWGVQSTP